MNASRYKHIPLPCMCLFCFAETKTPFQERVLPPRSFSVGSAVCMCPTGRGGAGTLGTALDSGEGGRVLGTPPAQGPRVPLPAWCKEAPESAGLCGA